MKCCYGYATNYRNDRTYQRLLNVQRYISLKKNISWYNHYIIVRVRPRSPCIIRYSRIVYAIRLIYLCLRFQPWAPYTGRRLSGTIYISYYKLTKNGRRYHINQYHILLTTQRRYGCICWSFDCLVMLCWLPCHENISVLQALSSSLCLV